jgi:predicted ATPase
MRPRLLGALSGAAGQPVIDAILRHIELLPEKVPSARSYPFSIPAVAALTERLDLHPKVTFLVGNNGSGKSTLIEAIAVKAGFNPGGGNKNFTQSLRPSESSLHSALRLARGARRERGGFFLRAETMFNVATEAEEGGYDQWETLHEMSHGEAFLWVALHKFPDGGLFVLDEPEAALSPQRQLAFLRRVHQLVLTGSQFVIATHSPILMAYPHADIWVLGAEGLEKTRYEDTEHYAVTRRFLMGPEKILAELFADLDDDASRARPARPRPKR